MERRRLADVIAFDQRRMGKRRVFETDRTITDLYCLDPGQEQLLLVHEASDKVVVVMAGRVLVRVDDESAALAQYEAAIAAQGEPQVLGGAVVDGRLQLGALALERPQQLLHQLVHEALGLLNRLARLVHEARLDVQEAAADRVAVDRGEQRGPLAHRLGLRARRPGGSGGGSGRGRGRGCRGHGGRRRRRGRGRRSQRDRRALLRAGGGRGLPAGGRGPLRLGLVDRWPVGVVRLLLDLEDRVAAGRGRRAVALASLVAAGAGLGLADPVGLALLGVVLVVVALVGGGVAPCGLVLAMVGHRSLTREREVPVGKILPIAVAVAFVHRASSVVRRSDGGGDAAGGGTSIERSSSDSLTSSKSSKRER